MYGLSWSVAVTRTPFVDSGPGAVLFSVFTKKDEGRRVVHAVLAAVYNPVHQHSLPQTPFLEQGIATHLSRLLQSSSAEFRLNAVLVQKLGLQMSAGGHVGHHDGGPLASA